MTKPLVFLSHIAAEAELAITIKALVARAFSDTVEVFVSSDAESLRLGDRWLTEITTALNTCRLQLILCSAESIKRPWIYFEAGACWIREVPVVPLCHSGMERSALPPPLNALQAANLTDKADVARMIEIIASELACTPIVTEDIAFIDRVRELEHQYTFYNHFDRAIQELTPLLGFNGAKAFFTGEDARLGLTEVAREKIKVAAAFLVRSGFVTFSKDNSVFEDGSGTKYGVNVAFTDRYRELIADYVSRTFKAPSAAK